LLLALCAVKELESLDKTMAQQQVLALAKIYGRESGRVQRHRRAPPPMPSPRAEASLESTAGVDAKMLKVMAADACDKAAAAARSRRADDQLPFHPLLAELEADDLAALVPLIQLRAMAKGQRIIEEGGEGASFFIVVRGLIEVARQGTHLAYLRSGAFFGEMALLTRSARTASVTCEEPALLLELDRSAVEELAGRSPDAARVLADYTRRRLLGNLMATSPLFKPLDPDRREALIEMFVSSLYDEGEVVLAEGAHSPGLHVVLSGMAMVTRDDDGEQLRVAELLPGQVFGEISLIQDSPATATISASRKTVVLCLQRDDFNGRVSDFPEVLAHIYGLAAARRKANIEMQDEQPVLVDEELLI